MARAPKIARVRELRCLTLVILEVRIYFCKLEKFYPITGLNAETSFVCEYRLTDYLTN